MLSATHVVTLNAQVIAVLSGVVIPMLVGAVTKLHCPSVVQAGLNLLLSAVAGAVGQIAASNGKFVLEAAVVNVGVVWVTSIATYYGWWKPSGLAPALQRSTRNVGVGPAGPAPVAGTIPSMPIPPMPIPPMPAPTAPPVATTPVPTTTPLPTITTAPEQP